MKKMWIPEHKWLPYYFQFMGERVELKVALRLVEYEKDGSTAIELFFQDEDEESEYGIMEDTGILTVYLGGKLPTGTVYLDRNNHPLAAEFIRENGLGTVKYANSTYPLCVLNMERCKELDVSAEIAEIMADYEASNKEVSA